MTLDNAEVSSIAVAHGAVDQQSWQVGPGRSNAPKGP